MRRLVDFPDPRKRDSSSMEWLLTTMEKATGRYWVYDANELRFFDFDEESEMTEMMSEGGYDDYCVGDAADAKLIELGWIPDRH